MFFNFYKKHKTCFFSSMICGNVFMQRFPRKEHRCGITNSLGITSKLLTKFLKTENAWFFSRLEQLYVGLCVGQKFDFGNGSGSHVVIWVFRAAQTALAYTETLQHAALHLLIPTLNFINTLAETSILAEYDYSRKLRGKKIRLKTLACGLCRVRVRRHMMPNTHRRRRRDETVLSRRVGDVYMNSQLAHDDCRRIRSTIWRLWANTQ